MTFAFMFWWLPILNCRVQWILVPDHVVWIVFPYFVAFFSSLVVNVEILFLVLFTDFLWFMDCKSAVWNLYLDTLRLTISISGPDIERGLLACLPNPKWCDQRRFMVLICLHRNFQIVFHTCWKMELIKNSFVYVCGLIIWYNSKSTTLPYNVILDNLGHTNYKTIKIK